MWTGSGWGGTEGEVTQSFFIGARLPGLNELIELRARSPHAYRRAKEKWGQVVAMFARRDGMVAMESPVRFRFHFVEPDARRDPDNVCSAAIKVILDALKKLGTIPDDSQAWVKGIVLSWEVGTPIGVKVTMEEA